MPGTSEQPTFIHVGRSLLRPEDFPLLRGEGHFVGDLQVPGCLDAAFVRSYLAHGTVGRVGVDEARAAPGVAAVLAAADLAHLPDVPGAPRAQVPEGMARRPLAGERVRYVGEPLAVVVADNRYLAEDAAALVEVELDPLPAVLDPVAALESGSDEIFAGTGNLASAGEVGAPCEAELEASPVVIDLTVENQRVAPLSLEARAILVEPVDGGLTVFCGHQAPHRLRSALAEVFGLDPGAVRVIVPFVGGAFGAKSQVYPEYVAVAAAALALKRPVRWIEDRAEAFTAATHGRGQHTRLRLGLDGDGHFLALDVDIVGDAGAYPHTGSFLPQLTAWMMSGPYTIGAVHVRTRSALTNKTPTASYRGAGRPEAAYALERLVDTAAAQLSIDPVELRRRNLIPDDAFPYRTPTGAVYDSGRYGAALDAALDAVDMTALRAEQRRRRDAGERSLLGVGVASWVERTGGQGGSSEYAAVELTTEGEIVARIGTATQGQGHIVAFAQVVAEATGVEPEQVRVLIGDTGEVPEGTGSFGSRSLQVGGTSAFLAGTDLLGQARRAAAGLFGVDVDEVVAEAGCLVGPNGEELSLADVGRRGGPLRAEHRFASPQAFPFGCYLAVVEVDRETGAVSVERLVAVDDVGVVVNPVLVEGQVVGSIAQGLGQALFEHARFDDAGNPVTTTLLDYHVATLAEIPELTVVTQVTPNPNVPLGTKGAGESGTIGAPPAIANAVFDALSDYDTTGLEMPLTSERVWTCLQRAR